MIRIKFYFKYSDTGEEADWEDSHTVTSEENAISEIKNLLEEFNKVEAQRYGETARLRKFSRLSNVSETVPHNWDKVGLFSGAIQTYRCLNCGLVIKRFIQDTPVRHSGNCYPDRVCKVCNREFKTAKNCEKHKKLTGH